MDDMESKFNAILGNPEMMQQIMAMAKSLGQVPTKEAQESKDTPSSQKPPKPPKPSGSVSPGNIDLSMLQKLSGLASQTNVDANERVLLKALGPYLSQNRIQKLEKAMRAAKLAQFASAALNQNQAINPPGR